MPIAFIGIGSNLNPAENVGRALRLLVGKVNVRAISTVFETEALGRPEGGAATKSPQPAYYNCVVEVETDLPPRELKQQVLRRIERELGRKRSADKYAPRTIDLDLALYGDKVERGEDMLLPDPDIVERPFLAIPLHELAPDLVVPGTGLPVAELAARMSQDRMRPLREFTDSMRREIVNG